MTISNHLGLPFLEAGQAQKHVTHNEALRILDALVQLSVAEFRASPPVSPVEGARYLVSEEPSGAFAGKENCVAIYEDGAWRFLVPRSGWIAYIDAPRELIAFDGEIWRAPSFRALQELVLLGIGTTADESNPFAAKVNNVLFTASESEEGGNGDLRFKVNKQSSANTASLLFQSGYAGRAEIGLTGDDDFRFKVSADGATWRDGIVVAADSGEVSFPHGARGLREKLTATRTYYVRTDGSDANNGRANNSTGAFATIQKALDVTFGDLDLGGFDVTLQLADGTYAGQVRQVSPQVGAGRVIVRGNASSPENVIVTSTGSDTAEGTIHMEGAAVVYVEAFEVRAVSRSGLVATRNGIVTVLGGMRFGAVSGQHMQATYGGTINVDGSYAVAGNAAEHWRAAHNSVLRCQSKTITIVGSLTMTRWARADIGGAMTVNSNTFTGGSVTGQRYQAATNGVVITGNAGESYLPGTSAGAVATGGHYS